jgi:pre-mRNA-splicing factor SYF1
LHSRLLLSTFPSSLFLQVGRLWTALADFHIRRGAFEVARDVYEEGLAAVATVRDFGLLFDALSHFEESLLAAKLAAAGDDEGECG